MRQLGYGDFVAKIITDIPYEQPFQTEKIAKAMADRYAIPVQKAKAVTNVTLKRLMDKGQLERFQKGIYYRTKQTVFGKTRPTANALEAQVLVRQGDEVIGYETGASLMNKIGLTTLVPKKREIATNAYRKKITDKNIVAKKPVVAVNADNYRYLQLLDAIKDLSVSHVDAENPKAVLHAYIQKNNLDPLKTLTYAKRYYTQKTVLNLVDVLVER
jgi:hypothetical protein